MTISDSLTKQHTLVTNNSKRQNTTIVARLRETGATVIPTTPTIPHDAAHRDLFITANLNTPSKAQTVLHQVRTRLNTLDILNPHRRQLALTLRRFRSAQRRTVAGRAEPEPTSHSPPRPKTTPNDDRGQVRHHHAHLLHPTTHTTVQDNP